MNQQQSELLLEQIRARYDKETITDILVNLGYQFDRGKKFKLREEEKSASTSVGRNGLINDFGGDGGDILKILTVHHAMSFLEAMKYTADQMGISYPDDNYQENQEEAQRRRVELEQLKLQRIERVKEEARLEEENRRKKEEEARTTIAWYDSYRDELQTFTNPAYKYEALAIAPLWVYKEATKEALDHFKYLTSFDHKNGTIIAKIYDHYQQLISYKRRRYTIPGNDEPSKWVTKGGTSPNKQTYISIPHQGSVWIIEGHHDMLTASLLQEDDFAPFNFIMVPTENYQTFSDYELQALKGREVNFIVDMKSEAKKESTQSMIALGHTLPESQADDAVAVDLFDFLEKNDIPADDHIKLDLSEVVEIWRNKKIALTSSLEYYADSIRNDGEIF